MDRQDVVEVDNFDDALDRIDDILLQEEQDYALVRGCMSALREGYEVPGHISSEELREEIESDNEFALAGLVPDRDPVPEYIPSVDEALQWGTEKGPEADQTRVAAYDGERDQNVGLSHAWETMDRIPFNLDEWDVLPEDQKRTRPVVMLYDEENVESAGGYRINLPEGDQRSEAIDRIFVLDQDPTSEEYNITRDY